MRIREFIIICCTTVVFAKHVQFSNKMKKMWATEMQAVYKTETAEMGKIDIVWETKMDKARTTKLGKMSNRKKRNAEECFKVIQNSMESLEQDSRENLWHEFAEKIDYTLIQRPPPPIERKTSNAAQLVNTEFSTLIIFCNLLTEEIRILVKLVNIKCFKPFPFDFLDFFCNLFSTMLNIKRRMYNLYCVSVKK